MKFGMLKQFPSTFQLQTKLQIRKLNRFSLHKSRPYSIGLRWQDRPWAQKSNKKISLNHNVIIIALRYSKTLGYTSIIFAGLTVIGITLYYLYDDSTRQSIIQSNYDKTLLLLKINQEVIKYFGTPKGLYEVEWVSRRGRHHIKY